jgi:hypothetical protein
MSRPGLAIERSGLAWNRTVLSALAVAALLLKMAITKHRPLEFVAAGAALFDAAVLWSALLERGPHHRIGPLSSRLLLTAVATLATCLFALLSLV